MVVNFDVPTEPRGVRAPAWDGPPALERRVSRDPDLPGRVLLMADVEKLIGKGFPGK